MMNSLSLPSALAALLHARRTAHAQTIAACQTILVARKTPPRCPLCGAAWDCTLTLAQVVQSCSGCGHTASHDLDTLGYTLHCLHVRHPTAPHVRFLFAIPGPLAAPPALPAGWACDEP